MTAVLPALIFWAGIAQFSVLVASALVPLRLNWSQALAPLPPLVRQLVWIYGGYVVLAIVSLGAVSVGFADELASGGGLARAVCGYAATFWGIRLLLQAWLDARPFLTSWWLRAGYHLLTLAFVLFTCVFAWSALQ